MNPNIQNVFFNTVVLLIYLKMIKIQLFSLIGDSDVYVRFSNVKNGTSVSA